MKDIPKKALLRVDEVATYFSLSERTIRSWIKNGYLRAEKIVGTIRIPRDAVLNCRANIDPKKLTKKEKSGNN